MVAVAPHLLSDLPPRVPQSAGLGDRFHYFRGASGRRYLFSRVGADEIGDFRSAVVMLARRTAEGGLAATDMTVLDRLGRPAGRAAGDWPPHVAAGTLVLVHLLSASERERFAILGDLLAAGSSSELPLAA